MSNNKKVLVAMSGGVDSSVAATLVKQQGFNVIGIMMKIWEGEDIPGKVKHHGCYGPGEQEDIEDAAKVAELLGIPFQVIDLTQEYKSEILGYFCKEYFDGRTPNPCVRCNHRMKFGVLINKARETGLDFDFIASGHYARVEYNNGRYLLKKARDLSKDQSYFLSFLSQEQFGLLMFPLGDLTKAEVRSIAARTGLQVADKPDSQNFISGNYSSMFKSHSNPGPIVNREGKVLGQHQGIHNYTVGQRKGIGITSKEILYVTALDPKNNAVIVGEKGEIFRSECTVSGINWIAISEINQILTAKVKIRSSHQEAEATLTPVDDRKVKIKFKEPQLAIAPGQTAVFYWDDIVVGGGIIT